MTPYELLKFVHVLSAAIWVGGAVTLRIQAARAEKETDQAAAAKVAQDTERIGKGLLMPASIVLLVTGLWMVLFETDIGFDPLWVKLGLGIYLLSALGGAIFLGPQYKKVGELRAAGTTGAELDARIARISLVSWIDLGLLVAAIYVMTTKPL